MERQMWPLDETILAFAAAEKNTKNAAEKMKQKRFWFNNTTKASKLCFRIFSKPILGRLNRQDCWTGKTKRKITWCLSMEKTKPEPSSATYTSFQNMWKSGMILSTRNSKKKAVRSSGSFLNPGRTLSFWAVKSCPSLTIRPKCAICCQEQLMNLMSTNRFRLKPEI